MSIRLFGTLPDGRPVMQVSLTNSLGMELRAIEYGATISDLLVPSPGGERRNVVLGYPDLEGYRANGIFSGATIGRTAGRITGGRFTLEGREYRLEINNPPNNVHGGSNALDKRLWKAAVSESPDGETVVFTCRSQDGDQGFPGDIKLTVAYTLFRNRNCLRIDYTGESDSPTPLNLTNHAYFNLNGTDKATMVDNHWISINADYYTPAGEDMTLLGEVRAVEGTPADLRERRHLGEAIRAQFNRHGENYLINPAASDPSGSLRTAAVVAVDDLALEVRTDAACVQFYGGQYIPDDHPGRNAENAGPRSGFCLECQDYPDGINHPGISDIILRPGMIYSRRTEWIFPGPI